MTDRHLNPLQYFYLPLHFDLYISVSRWLSWVAGSSIKTDLLEDGSNPMYKMLEDGSNPIYKRLRSSLRVTFPCHCSLSAPGANSFMGLRIAGA